MPPFVAARQVLCNAPSTPMLSNLASPCQAPRNVGARAVSTDGVQRCCARRSIPASPVPTAVFRMPTVLNFVLSARSAKLYKYAAPIEHMSRADKSAVQSGDGGPRNPQCHIRQVLGRPGAHITILGISTHYARRVRLLAAGPKPAGSGTADALPASNRILHSTTVGRRCRGVLRS